MNREKRNTATKIPKSKAKTAYGLLSEVRALILAEPLRYNQSDWLTREKELPVMYEEFPACGTVGCVAGWVATLTRGETFRWNESFEIAQHVLDLQDAQAQELFAGYAVTGIKQSKAHARAGAKHIAVFQKKYKAQLLSKKVAR